MKVYHGSKANFNKFNYDFIRSANATSEGIGFYFTDNKEIASGYAQGGFLYTVEFTGKKSLDSEKLTITKKELKNFLEELNIAIFENNDDGVDFLSNYDDVLYYGVDAVLNKAVNMEYNFSSNDVDLIGSIANASGNFEIVLKTLYRVLGFDCIILRPEWKKEHQKLYIATVNDIVNIEKVEKIGE